MSLRCKACDRSLDTRDPDYCSKCLTAIHVANYGTILEEHETDINIIDLVKKYEIHTA